MSERTDPRFDALLAKTPEFARPIVDHLRGLVHEACPGVRETVKWRHLTFVHRGKILCLMGVFKAHCRLHFWQQEAVLAACRDAGVDPVPAGQLDRLTSRADLPGDDLLRRYLETAVELAGSHEPAPPAARAASARRSELPVPPDFAGLLAKTPAAKMTLDALPPSHRREYLAWIAGAKREETRLRRMGTAVEWLAEGKRFDWKYQRAAAGAPSAPAATA